MKRMIIVFWIFVIVIVTYLLIFPFEQTQNYDAKEIDIFVFLDTPDSRLIKR
ncbi:MAG TPA: hypothetical protein GXX36_01295 [Clostridiaceae bacterium]|nr:hypothetical protein [Clostridiaceae bacterium]